MTNNIVYDITQTLNNAATEKDLLDLNAWIIMKLKNIRNEKALKAKTNLYVGAKVEWTGRKGYHKGEIIKINRTKAQVKEGTDFFATTWTVPMGMLKIINV